MPVPFAPLVGLALGALLAWFARLELAPDEEPIIVSRPFILVVCFAVLVYTPILGYFAAFHGDWAYLYLIPSHRVPSAIDLALVLLSGGTVPLGFLAAARPARALHLGTVGLLGGTPATVACVLMIVWQKRIGTSGTYTEFRDGFDTEPITASVLGQGVLWMGFVGTLGAAWCAWSMRRRHAP